ncbi:hypothetical protein BDF19DRAFT_495756 [Syncephalis fuscata]|nr:hypothetical protein BDF19DRAFT_495756 [Syncephalis fuscata]
MGDVNASVMSAVTSAPVYVRALYDYSSNDASALRFRRNDIIEVITQLDSGWWDGRCNGERGWFPSNFVEQVEPGIPESVFIDDDGGSDWKPSAEESTYPVADESELSRGIINGQALRSLESNNSLSGLSANLANGTQQTGGTKFGTNNNNNMFDSSTQVILAADDEELPEQTSTVLRLSRVPPNAWIPQETDEGHIYYYNPTTRITSWDLPPDGHELTPEGAAALAALDVEPQQQQFDSSAILDNYLSDTAEVNTNNATPNGTVRRNQHTLSGGGQEDGGNDAVQRSNERKTSAGSRPVNLASKRKPTSTETEAEIPDNKLPQYWGKKRTPEGRVYYFNMITDETLWSLSNIDMTTGKSLDESVSNRSSMHSNLSENSIEEAPYFTVNALARTPSFASNTTLAAHPESNLASSETRMPMRKPSGFVGKLHAHNRPMDSLDANGYAHNGAGNPEIGVSWSRLVALIVLAIHRLNHSAKRTTKSAYIADSLLIVDAISAMLMSSGTMQRDSPAIKAHNLLKAHHVHLMSALSKLVLSAKDASRVWPPPDAVQQMQRDANEVLLAARYFMNVAQDVGIPARSVDGIDVDALEVELSGPTTITPPTAANGGNDMAQNGINGYGRSRSSISSGNGNEPLYADQPADSIDLLVRFGEHSKSVLRMVSSMQRHLQHLRMDLLQLAQNNQAPASSQTITHAKQMVSTTEQFLQLVDNLRFDHVSEDTAERLIDARRTLQGEVIKLVIAVQEATDIDADVTSIESCIKHLSSVDTTAKELLIASKLQVEERDALRHRALEQNVDRFRAVQRHGDRIEATIRVRRALSMSHVATEGDRIETMLLDQDQLNDLDQFDEDDLRSASNHYGHAGAGNERYLYNGNGSQGYMLGKKMPMNTSRSITRLNTDPSIHRGATTAAMLAASKYIHDTSLSPLSDSDIYSDGPMFTPPGLLFNDDDEDSGNGIGGNDADEFNVNNYNGHWDKTEADYENDQPNFYPASNDLILKVAPWMVQSPEHSSASSIRLPQSQTMSSGNAAAHGNAMAAASGSSRSDMNRKVAQFFGEDAPLPGSTAPMLTSSKPAVEEKPSFLGYDYEENEIVFTLDGNVKGGTLKALVERCTLHDTLDTTFINNFLLTYRSFTTTEEFMDLLFKRFQIQPPSGLSPEDLELWRKKKQTPVRLRVFNIIKQWLESGYHEENDSGLLVKLNDFIKTTMTPYINTSPLLKLIEKRQKKSTDYTLRKLVRNTKQEAPQPILPKNLKKIKLLDIDPIEFARHLTIMDSQLYNKITPVECLNKAWSNKENSCSVNIKAMIEISNHLTHWVIESILQEKDARKRAQLIRHFVAIADRSMGLNNYNSLMAILAGLNSAPIHRLKRTWEQVSAKTTAVLDLLKARMNQTKNFSTYREGLHSIDPPCVPFLGVYLTDLTFIDDGNPDKLSGTNLINFSKYSKCADVITEIQQYQNLPYCLTTVPQIKMFLERNLQGGRDVQDLYNMSLNMEPREREDEKIARLLHESGFL